MGLLCFTSADHRSWKARVAKAEGLGLVLKAVALLSRQSLRSLANSSCCIKLDSSVSVQAFWKQPLLLQVMDVHLLSLMLN